MVEVGLSTGSGHGPPVKRLVTVVLDVLVPEAFSVEKDDEVSTALASVAQDAQESVLKSVVDKEAFQLFPEEVGVFARVEWPPLAKWGSIVALEPGTELEYRMDEYRSDDWTAAMVVREDEECLWLCSLHVGNDPKLKKFVPDENGGIRVVLSSGSSFRVAEVMVFS